jgi:hypothetical protein
LFCFHSAVKGGAVHAKELGRLAHVAARQAQRGGDVAALPGLQGLVEVEAAGALELAQRQLDGGAGGAGGAGPYMNNLAPRLEFSADATRAGDAVAMPQTAPGRYELVVPAPSSPTFCAVRLNGRVIDRFAVAGRYWPEFEHIGNDRPAMDALARATGGAVIEPSQTTPIDFRWPTRPVSLSAYLAAAGAICLVAGLLRWRIY